MGSDTPTSAETAGTTPGAPVVRKKRRWHRLFLYIFITLVVLLTGVRIALPYWVRWYVNGTLDKSPLYKGEIGDIDMHLLKGGYTIRNIRLDKTSGNVPVPFFQAERVDLVLEWGAILSGRIVGRIAINKPELNFVDAPDESTKQTGGGGGPWLEMIRELFPFSINSAVVHNGSIHFRAYNVNPPVDVYLGEMEASVKNLTNVHDDTTPLLATINATGLAMGQGKFDFEMKFDPFSYEPSFQLGVKLLGLDVTTTNALTQAYGDFDFERGSFDFVTELNAKEGTLDGYIKPLFRHVQIFSLKHDIKKDNALQFFWEALVGAAEAVLKNQSRDQFGTVIPVTGTIGGPKPDLFVTIGNVLRNAFIRAYLPRYDGGAPVVDGMSFGMGSGETETGRTSVTDQP